MSPPPLKNFRSVKDIQFTPDALKRQPILARRVAQVIALGSVLDFRWSEMLTDLLKGDYKISMAMYQALAGAEAKRAALLGAATASMFRLDLPLFRAVGTATKEARDLRNRFAHHLWGESKELPKALLLADPNCILDHRIGVRIVNSRMRETRSIIPPPDIDRSRILVYRAADLDDAVKTTREATITAGMLAHELHMTDGQIGEHMRLRLLSRPLVSQALQRQSTQSTKPTRRKPRG